MSDPERDNSGDGGACAESRGLRPSGTTSFAEADGELRDKDRKLLSRAARERWAVPAEMRKKAVGLIGQRLENPLLEDRAVSGFVKVLVDMDRADLARDEFEDKRDRLDAGESTENHSFRVTFGNNRNPTPRALPETEGGDLGT